jgi:uroporphyrinogen-III decarboxylase
MMRQAGHHIAEYRALSQQYPTFRQRSEIMEVAVEVTFPYVEELSNGWLYLVFGYLDTPYQEWGVYTEPQLL